MDFLFLILFISVADPVFLDHQDLIIFDHLELDPVRKTEPDLDPLYTNRPLKIYFLDI